MRLHTLIPCAGLVALVLLAAPFAAMAQSASFSVSQNGASVGTASFSFVSNPTGYDSTSIVRVNMQGLSYQLSKTEQLSPSNGLLHVQLSAIVNDSAVNVVAKPDAAQFLLNISANGRASTTRLEAHSFAVFLPDFDPGALETLLAMAARTNNRGLWAIIPKQAGTIEPIQLATYPDEQGTLDGKPIVTHHLVATIAGNTTDLFAGPENQAPPGRIASARLCPRPQWIRAYPTRKAPRAPARSRRSIPLSSRVMVENWEWNLCRFPSRSPSSRKSVSI